jgi:hypothetical protein|tara:strand:+ start:1087 stop:1725 length:639 start_codon:yes stop_codon:yes gene_type:complete
MKITDKQLSEIGLKVKNNGRLLLIACGALAREILAVIKTNAWDHIDIQCLPAIYHNHPEKIVPAIRKIVIGNIDKYSNIFVVYADCGTGGQLKKLCNEMGLKMINGPHCYSFFEGNEVFQKRDELTSFYLTDFLVRQFDSFFWRPMGLDKHPELRDVYFSNYTTLVYQAQIKDKKLQSIARDCARRMGLAYEYRFTGYGDLETALHKVAQID